MSNPMESHAAADAALERIKKLEQLLAASPANSVHHRDLTDALRIETTAYRKSLDADQAAKTLDPRHPREIV